METGDKLYVTNYDITTPYFISDLPSKIMVASDIHYQPSVSRDLFLQIVRYAQESKPDFIVMPGDLVETIDFLDSSDNKAFFESIIRGLGEVAPVIIVPGNHDLYEFRKENVGLKHSTINTRALKFFESLNRFKNVYFLNNEQTTINGLTFLGFNPRVGTYLRAHDKKTEEDFMEDYLKSGLTMAEDAYNILLTHSPIHLTSVGVQSAISDFSELTDLAITGHLHDGYLPKALDKALGNTKAGLFFCPLVAPYPGILCRGVHDFGRGQLFISQGYRKWTADVWIMNAFERITANDLEQLILSRSENRGVVVSTDMPFSSKK